MRTHFYAERNDDRGQASRIIGDGKREPGGLQRPRYRDFQGSLIKFGGFLLAREIVRCAGGIVGYADDLMPAVVDLIGEIFGRLTVMDRDGALNGHAAWLCRCNYGETITVSGNNL